MTGIQPDTSINVSSLYNSAAYFMTATLEIIDPYSGTETPYNFATNTGGSAAGSVVWSGNGRIHSLHSTRGFNLPGNYTLQQTLARVLYFQIPLHESDGGYAGEIKRGWFVHVTDGGDDQSLTGRRFVVESAINNSLFPTRTINTIVDMEVDPNWTS